MLLILLFTPTVSAPRVVPKSWYIQPEFEFIEDANHAFWMNTGDYDSRIVGLNKKDGTIDLGYVDAEGYVVWHSKMHTILLFQEKKKNYVAELKFQNPSITVNASETEASATDKSLLLDLWEWENKGSTKDKVSKEMKKIEDSPFNVEYLKIVKQGSQFRIKLKADNKELGNADATGIMFAFEAPEPEIDEVNDEAYEKKKKKGKKGEKGNLEKEKPNKIGKAGKKLIEPDKSLAKVSGKKATLTNEENEFVALFDFSDLNGATEFQQTATFDLGEGKKEYLLLGYMWANNNSWDLDPSLDISPNIYTTQAWFYLDTITPTTTSNISGTWQNSDANIQFTCVDSGSGCSKNFFSYDRDSNSDYVRLGELRTPYESNLVAYWTCNSADSNVGWILDRTSNNNDGNFTNGADNNAMDVFGQEDSACWFDGEDDYVDAGANPWSNAEIASGTMVAWVNLNQLSTQQRFVTIEGVVRLSYDETYNDRFEGVVWDGDDTLALDSGITPTQNTWYHLALTWDGTTSTLYVDGIEKASGSQSSPAPDSLSRDFIIGAAWNGSSWSVNGLIDEVRIYDRALSEKEVWAAYNSFIPWDGNQAVFDSEGNWGAEYFSIDVADNNESFSETEYMLVDKTAPTVSISSPSDGSSHTSTTVTLQYTGSDALSGIAKYWVRVDSGTWTDNSTNVSYAFTSQANGSHVYHVIATDAADNNSSDENVTVTVSVSSGDGDNGDGGGGTGGVFGGGGGGGSPADVDVKVCLEEMDPCATHNQCCEGLKCLVSRCRKPSCQENKDCENGYVCLDEKCTKLFDVKIERIDELLEPGEDLDFTYLLKNPGGIAASLELKFWLEKGGEIILQGQDVVSLESGEERLVDDSLMLFSDMEGKYMFYVEIDYLGEKTRAFREVEVTEEARKILDAKIIMDGEFEQGEDVPLELVIGFNKDGQLTASVDVRVLRGEEIVWHKSFEVAVVKQKRLSETLVELAPGEYELLLVAEHEGQKISSKRTFIVGGEGLGIGLPLPAEMLLAAGIGIIVALAVVVLLFIRRLGWLEAIRKMRKRGEN